LALGFCAAASSLATGCRRDIEGIEEIRLFFGVLFRFRNRSTFPELGRGFRRRICPTCRPPDAGKRSVDPLETLSRYRVRQIFTPALGSGLWALCSLLLALCSLLLALCSWLLALSFQLPTPKNPLIPKRRGSRQRFTQRGACFRLQPSLLQRPHQFQRWKCEPRSCTLSVIVDH
jgi:hypothetical protein